MFKKTETKESDLFDAPSNLMCKRASDHYNDPKAWHNQFFKLVTSQVNEENFRPLFKSGVMGAPTASIRELAAMSVLKEGFGCSDEELFEKCEYDLLTRRALGIMSLSEKVPSLDTYYCFRRRIVDYEERHGVNLMDTCFKDVTGKQVRIFKIQGRSIRMDSKLIGSNIAWFSRYRIILRTLQMWARDGIGRLNPSLRKKTEPFLDEDGQETEYRSSSMAIHERLETLGNLIYRILVRIKAKEEDGLLLYRVFHEQYTVEKGKAVLRDKKQVSAGSVQNPNDPDAHYRMKGDQKIKGYSVNITETNDKDGKPSIITDVRVKPASAADNGYLQDAVRESGEVSGSGVSHINADGAYQSQSNREFVDDNHIELVTTGLQGRLPRFDLTPDGDTLAVTDRVTGETRRATRSGEKWRITLEGCKAGYRYFTRSRIERAVLRKKLRDTPKEELDRRNNVEAAMFQVSFHTRNGKTRYRGLVKHSMWADARCMWMNFVRLKIFRRKTFQRTVFDLFRSFMELQRDYIIKIMTFSRLQFYLVLSGQRLY